MANFATHLKASILTSAALSSVILNTHIATAPQSITLFLIGALSGLLPDLDADNSTSIDWLFSILGLVLCASFSLLVPQSSLVAVWFFTLVIYFSTHYMIKPVFEKLTVHRGSFHSLFAIIMFSLIGVTLSLLLSQSLNVSLLVGVFITLGALTHLLLDELYSVDLENNTLKSSFGTAMKLIDTRYPLSVFLQTILVLSSLYFLYPKYDAICDVVLSWQVKLSHFVFMPQNINLFS
ncbi:metal-dependent hydrolase [Pseudoalteromonas denitrificans]|uniref:LexA-binding, inner membrane-associated putative hydrolase n=1 Tax=Pseudoalteromonas denitrificans DSM 6059 TaxID=1123010 RepID=A0A1I1UVB3_9GAMM|nr:metal-dependent hydrolase [Pseudoalteromonas denitrificans]SFD73618.1 LexA-binding, inner membrane-associated putative hydrolase [Pseudoalteromonas denitrificans DSM 6059]